MIRKENTMIPLEKIRNVFLLLFVLMLPFNLMIGRTIPATVSLPFYIADILILLLGLFFFFEWRRNKSLLTPQQKYIALFLFLFFCLGIMTILLNKTEIIQFSEENNRDVVVHSMLKQIISSDATQSINKTIQIALSLFLFLSISVSSLRKELLLKIACIPLALILLINMYLVITQQEVVLDGGREGVTIHPYGIKEIGRAYFPFVNSLLLSMYLSLFFFAVLFLFLNIKNKNDKKATWQKVLFGMLVFLLILVLGFTKGRAALLTVFGIFLFLTVFLLIRKLVSPFPKLFFCFVGIFLFLAVLSSFFTIPVFKSVSEEEVAQQEDISPLEKTTLRELDVDNTAAGRQTRHWPTALVLFQSNSFLGVGTGLYYYSVLNSHKEILCGIEEQGLWTLCPDKIQPTDISSTAHSIYLQVLAENGIVGFILFLLLLGSILVFGYKTINADFASLFFFFALLSFLIQGFFFSYFEYREMMYLFWIFIGLLLKK